MLLQAHLNTFPSFLPVPKFDGHIVTPREDKTLFRMHGEATNVIRMSFERGHFFARVVVEDS